MSGEHNQLQHPAPTATEMGRACTAAYRTPVGKPESTTPLWGTSALFGKGVKWTELETGKVSFCVHGNESTADKKQ
jgi:hypothetical protein